MNFQKEERCQTCGGLREGHYMLHPFLPHYSKVDKQNSIREVEKVKSLRNQPKSYGDQVIDICIACGLNRSQHYGSHKFQPLYHQSNGYIFCHQDNSVPKYLPQKEKESLNLKNDNYYQLLSE